MSRRTPRARMTRGYDGETVDPLTALLWCCGAPLCSCGENHLDASDPEESWQQEGDGSFHTVHICYDG